MRSPEAAPAVKALKGAVAGAVGTLAMDLVWYRRYRAGGGTKSFMSWEFELRTTSWDDVSTPGQVGRRLVRAVAGLDLPPEAAGLTSTVVHWATGTNWGAFFGLALGARERGGRGSGGRRSGGCGLASVVPEGVALGTTAVATSYVALPVAGLYRPIWEYDAKTVAKDWSAHLVYGVVTAAAYRALAR